MVSIASKQPQVQQSQNYFQASIGLSITCLATLSLHAIYGSVESKPRSPLQEPNHDFTGFSESQLQTLLLNLAIMNATLHTKIETSFDALRQSGTWIKHQPAQALTKDEIVMLGSMFALIFWVVGGFLYFTALAEVSTMYLRRTLSMTLVAANLGLAYEVFWLQRTDWGTCAFLVLWPMQAVMAGQLYLGKSFVNLEGGSNENRERTLAL